MASNLAVSQQDAVDTSNETTTVSLAEDKSSLERKEETVAEPNPEPQQKSASEDRQYEQSVLPTRHQSAAEETSPDDKMSPRSAAKEEPPSSVPLQVAKKSSSGEEAIPRQKQSPILADPALKTPNEDGQIAVSPTTSKNEHTDIPIVVMNESATLSTSSTAGEHEANSTTQAILRHLAPSAKQHNPVIDLPPRADNPLHDPVTDLPPKADNPLHDPATDLPPREDNPLHDPLTNLPPRADNPLAVDSDSYLRFLSKPLDLHSHDTPHVEPRVTTDEMLTLFQYRGRGSLRHFLCYLVLHGNT